MVHTGPPQQWRHKSHGPAVIRRQHISETRSYTGDSAAVFSRRHVLAGISTASAVLLAGCGLLGSSPDVVVFNKQDSALTAEVELTDSDGERLLSEEASIEAGDGSQWDDVLPSDGSVTLAVSVEGGPAGESDFDVTGEDSSLQARIDGDIEFDLVE